MRLNAVESKALLSHTFGYRLRDYGLTRKATSLKSVPSGVVTRTLPVVAPAGTVAEISEAETTVNAAAVPWKPTLVAPVRFVPRILTAAPTLPGGGVVFTKGPSPTERLKRVPPLLAPPVVLVP